MRRTLIVNNQDFVGHVAQNVKGGGAI